MKGSKGFVDSYTKIVNFSKGKWGQQVCVYVYVCVRACVRVKWTKDFCDHMTRKVRVDGQ